MATREAIEQLKREWEYDPIWDIECTKGFEEHEEDESRITCGNAILSDLKIK